MRLAGLTKREVAILRVLSGEGVKSDEIERGLYAGRVARLAGFTFSLRMDAGTTRTLDSMLGKGYVHAEYSHDSRRWWITDQGRAALGAYAFGEV